MPTNLPMKPKWRAFLDEYLSIILICAFFVAVVLVAAYQHELREMFSSQTAGQSAAKPQPAATERSAVTKLGTNPAAAPARNPAGAPAGTNLPTVIKLGPSRASPPAGALDPARIQVIDGDTVRVDGQSYRLVGIDTPESGSLAKCTRERDLAARATRRLGEIVASGSLRLDRVACAECPPGTEGTLQCNYGRFCGVLTTAGRDVGLILIGEGLAHRYNCSATQCPPRQAWCS